MQRVLASYLQRIGRTGRATGTALIISVVNQQPHDLFFYGRPVEMLRGKVDPPDCWLDASAVLVRQFLAYCFDSATREEKLKELPRSGRQLVEDLDRRFLDLARSQALSYMEHYASLSGDRSDEREREHYQIVRSFDITREAPSGAVGNDGLPFGIEYRASVILREVNVGYQSLPRTRSGGEPGVVPFGVNQLAPEEGFKICRDCGIAVFPGTPPDQMGHRHSCRARRRFEKLRQEGRQGQPFAWESVYLYRELKSEAIRLLLPLADDADIDTLTACLYLGLRLRFEGNAANLIATPQIMPDAATGMRRYYLMLLDGVPRGTGYLKTLYQEKDALHRDDEGILRVLRLARNALETCPCRQIRQDRAQQDPDGCYRCIRTYHLQYRADRISRERGITLLGQLIEAGERRVPQRELEAIQPHALFGSMLEKSFVHSLRAFADQRNATWEPTIIRGNPGFRISLPGSHRLWELELQPALGAAQGVTVPSQLDFLLRCDDDRIKPTAIFTDSFQFHCHPANRLADDLQKRRAILESGQYHVWTVTWDDLDGSDGRSGNPPFSSPFPVRDPLRGGSRVDSIADPVMVFPAPVAQMLHQYASVARSQGRVVPEAGQILCNGWEQLKAFLDTPHAPGWAQLAAFAVYFPSRGCRQNAPSMCTSCEPP